MNSSKNKIDQHHLLVKQSGITPWMCRLFLTVFAFSPLLSMAQNYNIIYPANSGVVNMVTDTRYLIKEGESNATNNTIKIQKAIDDCKGKRGGSVSQLLYFPNGTYYVNNKITLGTSNGTSTTSREVTLQGQSKDGAIIRLVNSTFSSSTSETPVLAFFEGSWNNNAMGNYVKNLTIDIGSDNAGAVGLAFHNNNYGGINDIIIKSSDPDKKGKVGLKMNKELMGIGYFKNITIEGFDYGIKTGSYIESCVFEDIELKGQLVAGIHNSDKPIQIRRLKSTNSVPAIINTISNTSQDGISHVVLIDSELINSGSSTSTVPAIDNQYGFLFVRNTTSTYPVIIKDSLGVKNRTSELLDDGEFSSAGVYSLWSDTPKKTMNMPIKDAPDVPWDATGNWIVVDPNANGDEYDSDAIMNAINSGKTTVCIKYGSIKINKPIEFPVNHNVKRFIVLGQFKIDTSRTCVLSTQYGVTDDKQPVFKIGTGLNEVLVIEGVRTTNDKTYQYVQNNSTKTVILRHNAFYGSNRIYRNTPGAGTLFIEDMATLAEHPYGDQHEGTAFLFDHQEVYARSFNPENMTSFTVNDGGKLWVMGYKTEGIGICFDTKAGGFTEVLGGGLVEPFPGAHYEIIRNENSHVSIITLERSLVNNSNEADLTRTVIAKDIRGTTTKQFNVGSMPIVEKPNKFHPSTVVPLYIGYVNESVRNLYVFSPVTYFGSSHNYTPLNSSRWEVAYRNNNNRYHLNTTEYANSNTSLLGEYSIVNNKSYSDFTMTLKFESPEPSTNTTADFAMVFGYIDANNYRYIVMNRNINETKAYLVTNGTRTLIGAGATQNAGISTAAAYSELITINRTANRIVVTAGSRTVYDFTNNGFFATGGVGIGSYNDEVYFDDVNVTGTIVNPTAQNVQSSNDELSLFPEAKSANETTLYPNPANEKVFIDMVSLSGKGSIQVQVIGLQGQIIISKSFPEVIGLNHLELNTTNLTSGTYVVRISGSEQTISKKLIIAK